MQKDDYLKIGRASDFKNLKDRVLFRFFEILPGALSWGILFLTVFLSWQRPFWIAVFIIIFVIFWFFRTIYFSFHLWTGYKRMGKNEKINWIEKLNALPPSRYSLPTIKHWNDIYPHTKRAPTPKFGGEGRGQPRPGEETDEVSPRYGVGVYHLIVIPMHKEPLEVVRDNFRALKNTDYPKDKMIVVLACEQRGKDFVKEAVEEIEREFGSEFFKFMVTWHPADLPGEIAGKGSNETWAAKKAKEIIIDPLKIPYENIIFSSFDTDTCVFPKYFSCLTYRYLTSKKPMRTSFQPVPLYINNIWQAPVISRLFSFSSSFWQTMNQERPEKLITFSSHSMSFRALADVGFKQTNVVSDDSRIFWQCFLKYKGDYRVQPLYYPVSMDANVAKTFFRTLINIYKQQRRWAYGMGDIPYFLFGFYKDGVNYRLGKKARKTLGFPRNSNKKIPFGKKISLGFELIEGHLSWATASFLIFLLGWLPLILGGPEFSQTLISYNLPKIISRIMTIAMIGLISSAYLSFLLLPPKPPEYGRFKYLVFFFGWFLLPIIMIFFTALPALDAQTRWLLGKYMGFWSTEKVRK